MRFGVFLGNPPSSHSLLFQLVLRWNVSACLQPALWSAYHQYWLPCCWEIVIWEVWWGSHHKLHLIPLRVTPRHNETVMQTWNFKGRESLFSDELATIASDQPNICSKILTKNNPYITLASVFCWASHTILLSVWHAASTPILHPAKGMICSICCKSSLWNEGPKMSRQHGMECKFRKTALLFGLSLSSSGFSGSALLSIQPLNDLTTLYSPLCSWVLIVTTCTVANMQHQQIKPKMSKYCICLQTYSYTLDYHLHRQ